MESIVGYAYEVGTYEVNLYKVFEDNGKIIFKIFEWRDFNQKEKIDDYVKELVSQGYKPLNSFVEENSKRLVLKRMENPVS